ncbi:TadE/TadG family type IV pilus assembly protein [Erythrobacter sp. F6033]|uniref:TadE/TadG family type IV pilus assembly protein n=1 Tax=Erythrobacter sp. F6033 TaxID=2926401 RepID=UPI001FF18B78|nr:TadE/TadG family type IV pilus assembly protein [Erythrobacter sp. F6033]MCK0128330.1 pilus assembly protein [Erythrobacter sp. F6033]
MMRLFKNNRLRKNESGATLTEFGLVAPVLILMIMGVFDMAHSQYTSALMNGAMQKAGRDLTLENAGSRESTIDQAVIGQVQNVVPSSATVTLEKLSHFDFEDIGEEEEYTDDNNDGICNDNEPFVDSNGNGQWDANRGESGIGGARDAVLYTAVVTYPRLFPMYGLAGLPQDVELRASTVLRNQPFDQQDRATTTGNCT